ncbi:MAG: hypothetical protein K6G80_09550 [Treponema sp.]|nr:hypothetical protein [Treponema sp.]
MKKIIAILSTALLFCTLSFAEGYICANDIEKQTFTSEAAQEDGFVLRGTDEKVLECQPCDTVTVGEDTFTQRFKFGSSKLTGIRFEAKAGEKVTVWGLSSSKTEARVAVFYNADKKSVGEIPVNAYDVTKASVETFTVPADGTYLLASKKNTIYIYQVKITK